MKILAVIPARGGSKGIPRKNVRLMAGKPLIYYAINNALSCPSITDVVVTSDDDEILAISERYGATPLRRASKLALDAVTLDPVIMDATLQMEEKNSCKYDIVITLQPTSPVLTAETLNGAIESFIKENAETYLSAVNRPHLSWSKNEQGYFPLYKERLNRQQLPPNYLETGAFVITRREFVTEKSRFGKNIAVYEIPDVESTDIDTDADWIVCESILRRKKIVLRADGYTEIGLGHIYHCLTLAYNLIGHEVMFVTRKGCDAGIEKLAASNFRYTVVEDDNDFFRFLEEYKPDVVVNDCLDTTTEYIKKLKTLCSRVVTVEDLGDGARFADVAINALYDCSEKKDNTYCGEKYICLRDEFLIAKPHDFSRQVKEVLVLFGGTDPQNLTKRIYKLARKMHARYPEVHFTFLTGIGYNAAANDIVTREEDNITIVNDAKFVSDYMQKADLAFTSQGRTVYEFAALGVPAIVLAQNERERLHTFAHMDNGFFNLGLGSHASAETIERTFEFLLLAPQLREEMRELMLSHEHNLKNGVSREVKLILGE